MDIAKFIIDSTETGFYDFGNYDRCLGLQWINDETKESEFGQHCTISILPKISESEYSTNMFTRNKIVSHHLEAVFKIGLCIPSSCSQDDIQTIFSKVFTRLSLFATEWVLSKASELTAPIDVYDWQYVKTDQCKIKTTLVENIMNAKGYQKISLAFLTTIVVINLYATWLDWSVKSSGWTRHFSLIRNYNGFINPVSTSRMTFLTKFQLVVHSSTLAVHLLVWFYCCKGWGLIANANNIMKKRNNFAVRGSVGDWITAMLFVYGSIARTMEYWKITGPSTSVISITLISLPLVAFTFITPVFFDGPIMSIFSDYTAEACLRSFGANLLFIQNSYRPIIDICLSHTWSVAVEFQILPVIILLVHLYKRSPKLAVIINSLIVIAGLLYTGVSAFIKDSHPHTFSRSLAVSPFVHWFENVYLPTPMNVWIYTLPPLWTYLIMNKYEKSNPILMKFTSCNKLLAALLLILQILPMIWVLLESHVYPPFLNFIYFIFYRLCTAALFSFVFMCNSDSLREFFTHPLDKEIFNENNNCINNNFESSSEKKIGQVVQTDEDNAVTQSSKKISSGLKNRLLHICSTLWRSAYYVHICMITLRYSIQRWSLNSAKAHISIAIECLALTFFAAFFFHLFVVGPVTSLISTIKQRIRKESSYYDSKVAFLRSLKEVAKPVDSIRGLCYQGY
uniref:Nose resistant-to-fluoxetine protein N-terminal domain-containing protein n=1 Tax=Tetranychus urticae TaxID=32264 RepID=T1KSQ3_TETUR